MSEEKTKMTYEQRINAAITMPSDYDLPVNAPIVAMFAAPYRPVVPPADGGDNMTSFEIVQVLDDTCALSTQDVALTMVFLGYRLNVNVLKGYEWSMTMKDTPV